MKKYIALILCVIVLAAFAFSACSKNEPQDTVTTTGTTASAAPDANRPNGGSATTVTTTGTGTGGNAPAPGAGGGTADESKTPFIVLQTVTGDVKVGDKITVTVVFNSFEDVKSIGLKPVYDEESFAFVDARMLITGEISEFLGGIGVVAFGDVADLDGINVMQIELRATKAASRATVGCEVSVKGEGDKVIVVSQPADVAVEIKSEA